MSLTIEIDSTKAVAAVEKRIAEFSASRVMRAKMQVYSVESHGTSETLRMHAVCKSEGYPLDGSDEDNSYAHWTPFGELTLGITNPALTGKFARGDKFYLDFTRA